MPAQRTRRSLRQSAAILERHADETRLQLDTAELASAVYGETAGVAVVSPSDLARLLETDPAAAWLTLAKLTAEQLVVEAIDYTSWLNETSGRTLAWGAVLDVFERRIARLAAAA